MATGLYSFATTADFHQRTRKRRFYEWYPAIVNNDEFRDVVLEENVVEVAFLAMTVPGVCGMRLECPVLVTKDGGEMLCKTPLALTVLEV